MKDKRFKIDVLRNGQARVYKNIMYGTEFLGPIWMHLSTENSMKDAEDEIQSTIAYDKEREVVFTYFGDGSLDTRI